MTLASLPSTEGWPPNSLTPLYTLSRAMAASDQLRALIDREPAAIRLLTEGVNLRRFLAEETDLPPDHPLVLHAVPPEAQGRGKGIPATYFVFIPVPAINGPIAEAGIKLHAQFRDAMRAWCYTPIFCPPPPISAEAAAEEAPLAAALGQLDPETAAELAFLQHEEDLAAALGQPGAGPGPRAQAPTPPSDYVQQPLFPPPGGAARAVLGIPPDVTDAQILAAGGFVGETAEFAATADGGIAPINAAAQAASDSALAAVRPVRGGDAS